MPQPSTDGDVARPRATFDAPDRLTHRKRRCRALLVRLLPGDLLRRVTPLAVARHCKLRFRRLIPAAVAVAQRVGRLAALHACERAGLRDGLGAGLRHGRAAAASSAGKRHAFCGPVSHSELAASDDTGAGWGVSAGGRQGISLSCVMAKGLSRVMARAASSPTSRAAAS